MKVNLDEITCPICLAVLREPMIDGCGHTFCRLCIEGWLAKSSMCPMSNSELKDKPLYPNLVLKRMLAEEMGCEFGQGGCPWRGTLATYHQHTADCSFKAKKVEEKRPKSPEEDGFVDKIQGFFEKLSFGKIFRSDSQSTKAKEPEKKSELPTQKSEVKDKKIGSQVKKNREKTPEPVFQDPPKTPSEDPDPDAPKVFKQKEVTPKFSGDFIVKLDDGSTYTGMLVKGKRVGKGTLEKSSGEKYVGQWRDDLYEGEGTLVTGDGSEYTGDFVAGKRHGTGRFKNHEIIYQGEWKNDQIRGKGTANYPNGSFYEGDFRNGKPEGMGRLRDEKGNVYEGVFRGGQKEGAGKLVTKSGGVFEGTFEKGLLTGKGIWSGKNGESYKGGFLGGKKSGSGVLTTASKDRYEGAFRDDLFDGTGIYQWADGSIYEGEWLLGTKHGQGKIKLPSGEWFSGTWKNDERESGLLRRADGRKWLVTYKGKAIQKSVPYSD